MTNQEILNLVYPAIVKQGGMSVGSDGFCAYRGENGMRCAVGWLIDDENYRHALESQTVDGSIVVRKALGNSVGEVDIEFCSALQDAHDAFLIAQTLGKLDKEEVESWETFNKKEFERLADEWNLELPEV